jgi:hypothetical protein
MLLLLGAAVALTYAGLALAGDLRGRIPAYLVVHALLCGAMLAAWRLVRGDPRRLGAGLACALVFRLVAAAGEPLLSDDVYRYVWDGRVQLHGIHPYAHAPSDPALAALRDDDWARINHPELRTLYPPLAEAAFAGLVAVGLGPGGFKLAMGLADFGVVLALAGLLKRRRLDRDRVMLYAWNPLAVIESAGSGHLEPLAILPMLLAMGWIIDRRPALSTLALAAGVQVKLVPLLLAPGHVRRCGVKAALLLPLALVASALPYALTGPALGAGLVDYAERWEHNAFVYAGIERALLWLDTASYLKPLVDAARRTLDLPLPWEALYRAVWPREVARIVIAVALGAWVVTVLARRLEDPLREGLWILGGMLVLSPTVHPWYVLWVLPLAAARRSWGWLLLAALVPVAYCGTGGDVPWWLRAVEYGMPLALSATLGRRAGRRAERGPCQFMQ